MTPRPTPVSKSADSQQILTENSNSTMGVDVIIPMVVVAVAVMDLAATVGIRHA
ncbi:hypothetical protein V7S43_016080 [Phytophthora oleae]|uniref:Uncharacterized protein n=1 Tax=Phytophthora oleae TaxID=2107226 RepID=A0ABD3EZ30_9STRA